MRGTLQSQYFGYGPAANHAPDCPEMGTPACEASIRSVQCTGNSNRYEDEVDGKAYSDITFRLLCRACGHVVFYEIRTDTEPSIEHTHVADLGYGSKPERSLGLWLHPGPSISGFRRDYGPSAYYVTASREIPRDAADVLGIIGWSIGPRGAVHWSAARGCTDRGYPDRSFDETFKTRRGAVQRLVTWLANQAPAEVTS